MLRSSQRPLKQTNYLRAGVQQGWVLSTLIFNIVLDAILDFVLKNFSGISWDMTGKRQGLDYANDNCVLYHSHHDVQYMLDSHSN